MNNENFKLLDKTKKTANYIKNITINIPKSERNPTMKNLKVTINRSAGVKKYEVLPRQEKDMRGCCFCIKNANCQKKRKYAVPG